MKQFFPLILLLLTHCGSPLTIDPPAPQTTAIPPAGMAETVETNPWFKIIIIDVGQGDEALLIEPSGKAALIDTGPPDKGAQALFPILHDQAIDEIQNIFISHYHEDHTGGLNAILAQQKLKPSVVIDKHNAVVGQTIALGPVAIQVKATNGQIGDIFSVTDDQQGDENNLSLALLVQYGNFRYFSDGDLPGGGGEPPYQTIDLETSLAPLVGDVDILHIPHHGSHTSSNVNFLAALKPEVVVISVGDKNEFFHPHPSVMERLKKTGAKIYQTERGWLHATEGVEVVNGSICILTDGKTYVVKPYAEDRCASPPALSN